MLICLVINGLRQTQSRAIFKKQVISLYGREAPAKYNTLGSKIGNIRHTQIRVGLANIKDHQFKIGKTSSPICDCGDSRETSKHYVLICSSHREQRQTLFSSLTVILGAGFLTLNQNKKMDLLVYGTGLDKKFIHRVAFAFQKFLIATAHTET